MLLDGEVPLESAVTTSGFFIVSCTGNDERYPLTAQTRVDVWVESVSLSSSVVAHLGATTMLVEVSPDVVSCAAGPALSYPIHRVAELIVSALTQSTEVTVRREDDRGRAVSTTIPVQVAPSVPGVDASIADDGVLSRSWASSPNASACTLLGAMPTAAGVGAAGSQDVLTGSGQPSWYQVQCTSGPGVTGPVSASISVWRGDVSASDLSALGGTHIRMGSIDLTGLEIRDFYGQRNEPRPPLNATFHAEASCTPSCSLIP